MSSFILRESFFKAFVLSLSSFLFFLSCTNTIEGFGKKESPVFDEVSALNEKRVNAIEAEDYIACSLSKNSGGGGRLL